MKKIVLVGLLSSFMFGGVLQTSGEHNCYVKTTGHNVTFIKTNDALYDKEEGTEYKFFKTYQNKKKTVISDLYTNSSGDVYIQVFKDINRKDNILLVNETNVEIMDVLNMVCK